MSAAWMRDAACAGMPNADDVFFPEAPKGRTSQGPDYRPAKAICDRCPVMDLCLQDALSWEIPSTRAGVRGGLTPDERQRLTKLDRQRRGPAVGSMFMTQAEDTRRRDLWALGLTDRVIGERVGVSAKVVTRWRQRRGLAPNGRRERVLAG